jgi:23S rRNA (cytosine1962-C5)-methyltransferase
LSREDSSKWGAKVTHVDASKPSIEWARDNQMLSGLSEAPIRWILDDCLKFMKKEVRKGIRYDAIIMDPPSYGKGPEGEVWKIEEKLPELLDLVRQILSANPLFIIFNMYSTELSSISLSNLLRNTTKNLHGNISCGELAIPHHSNPDKLLPMSIFSIWENN